MAGIKIMDLEKANEVPDIDELVVPIFYGHTGHVTKSISVQALASAIKNEVIAGGEVIMELTDNGIKFKQQDPMTGPWVSSRSTSDEEIIRELETEVKRLQNKLDAIPERYKYGRE